MEEYKIPLIAVVGPTASGKTGLGIEICKALGGEIVSCDSMQIYKGMDIATAKPTLEEMQGIPHHLIDFLPVDETFSVAAFCKEAKRAIEEINARGKLPVLTGGTGLYYTSLVDNVEFSEQESDGEYRLALKERAESEGTQALYDELLRLDPEAAVKIHSNNTGRIIRALEIHHTTGKTKTELEKLSKLTPSAFNLIAIGLDARDRGVLYDRINSRVDMMLSQGLVEEAKKYFDSNPSGTAAQAIGYKELRPYFDGEQTLEECVENLKTQTRHYAKRQLTWFRRDGRINFLYIDDYENTQELTQAALDIISRGVSA